MTTQAHFRGCLLGLAIGDAVGTTLEFTTRDSVPPVADMVGGGPFDLAPGEWTDDTSMALCLATSLVECNKFDARDQMDRYVRWQTDGYLSSNGECFDIGNTVADALARYRRSGVAECGSTDPDSAGNGSLMRLAPIPMFFHSDERLAEDMAAASSRVTHGATECVDACRWFAGALVRALHGKSKNDVLFGAAKTFRGAVAIESVARGHYQNKARQDIHSSGYVVHSVEAAAWCFASTENYENAVLTAANLGGDADTTAAICGQLAGAFYSVKNIPRRWLECVVMRREIEVLADRLYDAGKRSNISAGVVQ